MAKKLENLPKHYRYERDLLNEVLLESDGYKESIEKGLPFFTKEELAELRGKYPYLITWDEIDAELSKKGMIFKKATFRKYIQEKMIPPASEYRSTKTGREARYPSKTIEQINFIQYCYRIADMDMILKLFKKLSEQTNPAREAIEGLLESRSIRGGAHLYIKGTSYPEEDIELAIRDVLQDAYGDLLLRDDAGPVELKFNEDWEVVRWAGEFDLLQAGYVKESVKKNAHRFLNAVGDGMGVRNERA